MRLRTRRSSVPGGVIGGCGMVSAPSLAGRFARRQVRTAEAVIRRYPASAPPSARGSEPTSKPPGTDADQVRVPEGLGARLDRLRRVTGRLDRVAGDRGDARLDQRPRSRVLRLGAFHAPARRRDRLRGGAAPHDRVRDRLRVDLWLPVAAHRSGHQHEAVLVVEQRRHQRVGRQLARRERVRMPGLHRETRAAVLGHDPRLGLVDARPEIPEQALDQRHRPPRRVGGDQRDGVAPRHRPGGDGGSGAPDLVGDPREVPLVEQDRRVEQHRVGIGEMSVAVAGRRGDDASEHACIGAVRVGVQAEPFHQRQDLEQREPLRIGRDDRDVQLTERCAQRRQHGRPVRREILDRDRAPSLAEPRDVGATDLARVEHVRPTVGQRLQRGAERGLDDARAHRLRGSRAGRRSVRGPDRSHAARRGRPGCRRASGSPRGRRTRARSRSGTRRARGAAAPFVWSSCQPATAPGTVIGAGPRAGISASRIVEGSASRGERPLEFSASTSPSGRWISANRSPPTPHMCG